MGIRAKILSGFLILATMLLVAGAWSIHELRNIGASAQAMLEENYQSIDAAKQMTEALERQDSAVLLILLNKRQEGVTILREADEAFRKASDTARNNITVAGEKEAVEALIKAYDEYRTLWLQPVAGAGKDAELNWYFQDVNRAFLKAKLAVADLMSLNHRAMYETASAVEARAYRATMPGIIAIASAFLFALLFSFLVNYYVIGPLVRLTAGIGEYLERGKPLHLKVDTEDEISSLIASVEALIKRSIR